MPRTAKVTTNVSSNSSIVACLCEFVQDLIQTEISGELLPSKQILFFLFVTLDLEDAPKLLLLKWPLRRHVLPSTHKNVETMKHKLEKSCKLVLCLHL